MLHDGGWPISVISHLVDPVRAEAAALGIVNSLGYSRPSPPRFPAGDGYVQIWGADIVFEMAIPTSAFSPTVFSASPHRTELATRIGDAGILADYAQSQTLSSQARTTTGI
jgi:hypothetical protein